MGEEKGQSKIQLSLGNNVVVIGAGTMGSGIAAHLANLGFNVSLLDLTIESTTEAFQRSAHLKPPHFFLPETANAVQLGSIRNNLDWVSNADWVCEVIVEKLDIKRALFAQIEPLLRPDAMISTNTSGLQIELLGEGMSPSFRQRFVGTHFFNPPRYLKLLELIPTTETAPEVLEQMTEFLENRVARRVVLAKDTPGFIANRYGMWCMFQAIHTAEKLHLSIEQVDAITGPFMGRPRTASFRLNDLVGLDIMQDIANNLIARCPNDPHVGNLSTPASMKFLMEKGWIGEKSGQGYYRRADKELLALDLRTHAYRQRLDPDLPSIHRLSKMKLGERLAAALELRDEVGEYVRGHIIPILQYATYLKEEISHNVLDFDRVMMWGFGWEAGPFKLIDEIGTKALGINTGKFYEGANLRSFNDSWVPLPDEPQYRQIGDYPITETFENFVTRDLGDGVTAVCNRTKMGSITPELVRELINYFKSNDGKFVWTSDGRAYSVGYDLNFFLNHIQAAEPLTIETGLKELHALGELMESKRIVTAAFGHCLGAGLELGLSTSCIVALADTNLGLPEAKVGLIPGGRGTVLARLFNQDPVGNTSSVNRLAAMAMALTQGMTGNPDTMRHHGVLRQTDVTVFHPDRLITEAKRLALMVEPVVRPGWRLPGGPLTGVIDREQKQLMSKGVLSPYDEVVGDKIKAVFSKTQSYEEAKEREIKEFLELCFNALTQARIKNMLEFGKPLRN